MLYALRQAASWISPEAALKPPKSGYASPLIAVCGVLLFLAPALAEDLLLEVKARQGNFLITDKFQVSLPIGKETAVQAGSRYKLKIVAALMPTLDMVRLTVKVEITTTQIK